jgi:nicotinic acid mononucleotide adenylyltransferase
MQDDPPLQPLLRELRTAVHPLLVLRPDQPDLEPESMALVAGSFDPVTVGHVALAEVALDRSDVAVFVYSIRTLPKQGDASRPLLTEIERIAALEWFCRSRPRALVGLCSHGLLSDQVTAARRRFPRAVLSLVMGSDKVLQLLDPVWYEDRDAALARLFEQADVRYAVRAGEARAVESALADLPGAWRARFTRLDVPESVAAISSRSVRERLRRGEDVRALVPPEVHAFLAPPVHESWEGGESFP